MQQVREIKKRIATVSNISHLTKAMKTLATARVGSAKQVMKNARVYEEKMSGVVHDLVSLVPHAGSPLITRHDAGKYAFVIMTADLGFCGTFNHNIIHSAMDFIDVHKPGEDLFIIAMGGKILSLLNRWGIPTELSIPRWKTDYGTARVVIDLCTDMFLSGKVDRVLVLYSRPAMGMKMQAYRDTLLPLSPEEKKKKDRIDYIVEPSSAEAINNILPVYLRAKMFRMMAETRAGELSARVQSMTNANENAENLLSELTLQYYRARQESITSEIIEITSATETMK
ncbi:MAG: ATP synthase F1 subunit gamma [Candidatus Eremiobacteraeota bacterium]|nr:ATP synthase F1 subunit gamma [Candidatus Eremiobacteraeota bacterium]